jgi:hypothetical protein
VPELKVPTVKTYPMIIELAITAGVALVAVRVMLVPAIAFA